MKKELIMEGSIDINLLNKRGWALKKVNEGKYKISLSKKEPLELVLNLIFINSFITLYIDSSKKYVKVTTVANYIMLVFSFLLFCSIYAFFLAFFSMIISNTVILLIPYLVFIVIIITIVQWYHKILIANIKKFIMS